MKQSQFVDALTSDIDGTTAGSSAVLEALTAKKGATASSSVDDEGEGAGAAAQEIAS